MKDYIELINEEGTVEKYYIIEETRLAGVSYILVSDSREDEAEAWILKDISDPASEEAEYVFVEDREELDAVVELFDGILEDVDLV